MMLPGKLISFKPICRLSITCYLALMGFWALIDCVLITLEANDAIAERDINVTKASDKLWKGGRVQEVCGMRATEQLIRNCLGLDMGQVAS